MLVDWPEIGGYWVAEWRDRSGFLGWCGLFPPEDSGLVEIGYRFNECLNQPVLSRG